jgi:hypothetical protein
LPTQKKERHLTLYKTMGKKEANTHMQIIQHITHITNLSEITSNTLNRYGSTLANTKKKERHLTLYKTMCQENHLSNIDFLSTPKKYQLLKLKLISQVE